MASVNLAHLSSGYGWKSERREWLICRHGLIPNPVYPLSDRDDLKLSEHLGAGNDQESGLPPQKELGFSNYLNIISDKMPLSSLHLIFKSN